METRIRVHRRAHEGEASAPCAEAATPPAVFDRGCFLALLAGAASPFPHLAGSWGEVAPLVPFLVGVWFWVGLGCLSYGLVGRPLSRLLWRAREESTRLREAMTCPYCRDGLEDQASLCGRSACGTLYHPECWEECRQEYGGCAIYGCGHAHATEVGRFALRRRFARLVVAAVLFPPRAVARLREFEGWTFRQVWDEAKEHQRQITEDDARTITYGALNLAVSLAICGGLILLSRATPRGQEELLPPVPIVLSVVAVPLLMLRFPLLRVFAWGSATLVARAFGGELGALGRADAGTVLGRLFAGAGKKD